MIHLDTHVLIWLRAGELHRFPQRARSLLRSEGVQVSSMVVLELQLLHEIGRLTRDPATLLDELFDRIGLRDCELPASLVARRARSLTWTRDPFDRLIAATAMAADVPLLTADATMLEHCPVAVWG